MASEPLPGQGHDRRVPVAGRHGQRCFQARLGSKSDSSHRKPLNKGYGTRYTKPKIFGETEKRTFLAPGALCAGSSAKAASSRRPSQDAIATTPGMKRRAFVTIACTARRRGVLQGRRSTDSPRYCWRQRIRHARTIGAAQETLDRCRCWHGYYQRTG